MKYVAAGYTMVNDIFFADGKKAEKVLGGSVFSASAMALFQDQVGYVGTAGPDFEDLFGNYYHKNQIVCAIAKTLPHTHRYLMEYLPDGRWQERSAYGEAYEEAMREGTAVTAAHFSALCGADTQGIYLEAALNGKILDQLPQLRVLAPHAKIMWEMATQDILCPESRPVLLEKLHQVDIYSLNLPESLQLFDVRGEEEALHCIAQRGVPCFYRVGARGAWLVQEGRASFLPAVGTSESVDATGCGNASTAAALIGFAEGAEPGRLLAMANIAAALTARQLGPIPDVRTARAEAMRLLQDGALLEKMETYTL